MKATRITCAILAVAGLAACSGPMVGTPSYPDRTEVAYMSADRVTVRNYACRSTANGPRAHRFVDGEILEAQGRFGITANTGMTSNLGGRAEVNAEIARISRIVEADYGCAYLGSRDSRQQSPFG